MTQFKNVRFHFGVGIGPSSYLPASQTSCRHLIKQASNSEPRRMNTSEVLNIWRTKSQKDKRVTWRGSRFANEEDKRERQQVRRFLAGARQFIFSKILHKYPKSANNCAYILCVCFCALLTHIMCMHIYVLVDKADV